MSPNAFRFLGRAAICLAIASGACATASADERSSAVTVPLLPAYKAECAACHLAYPPAMLPATSWSRLMMSLQSHFGTDATLDPASVKELSAWLAANAGKSGRSSGEPPQDRITLSRWFSHEHDEVPPAAWKSPAVKSAANCGACHTRAEQGDFDERFVRIPR